MIATIYQDLLAELSSTSDITDVVSDRIYSLTIPEGSELPAISFQVWGGVETKLSVSDAGLTDYNIQFNVIYTRASEGLPLVDVILNKFNGFVGQLNSNTNVQSMVGVDTVEDVDANNTQLRRTIINFTITI